MSELTPERRKVVILGGSVAAMSGSIAVFGHNHPWLAVVWLCFLMVAAAYVIVQLIKIKRSRGANGDNQP